MIYIKTIFEDNKEEWSFNHVLSCIIYYNTYLDGKCEFVNDADEWYKLTGDRNSQVYASDGEYDEIKKIEADINLYREYFDWWIEKNNDAIKDNLRVMFLGSCDFVDYMKFEPEKRYYLSYRTEGDPSEWYIDVLSFDRKDKPSDPNNPGFDLIEVKNAEEVKEKLNKPLDSYLERISDKDLFSTLLVYCSCPADVFFEQLPEFKAIKGRKE